MKKLVNIFSVILATVIFVVSNVLPVFAMSNPDTITFYATGSTPTYKAFYNVQETGDRLYVAEGVVFYSVAQNITAGEAFSFQLLDTNGTAILAQVPLNDYGAKPISIYLSANQVSTLGLTVGEANIIRIIGNPTIFPNGNGNNVTAVLGGGDYVDQLLGNNGGIPTSDPLRNFIILVMQDIQVYDGVTTYLTTVGGYSYLTTTGGNIVIAGIPGSDTFCQIAFQAAVANVAGDTPTSTGAYASSLSPLSQWGSTAASGLTNLGIYLGIGQVLAGSVVFMFLVILLGIWVYVQTQSGLATLLIIGGMPFIGGMLGLVPLGLAFVVAIVLVMLLGFFFFARGAL